MYSENISGAQRQPNGNTIICEGGHGDFTEVNSDGEIVWRYLCPVDDHGPMTQGDPIPINPVRPDETMNQVFRIYRYAPDYPAFTGRDMTPGDYIELYPYGIGDQYNRLTPLESYPNPFTSKIKIYNATGKETCELINNTGQTIWSGKLLDQQDFSALIPGLYFLKVNAESSTRTIKIIKQ